MDILLSGIGGAMGREVLALARDGYRSAVVTSGVDVSRPAIDGIPVFGSFAEAKNTRCDVIVDFSHRSNTFDLLKFATGNGLPLVLATTGQTDDEREAIIDASNRIPLFFAANYSLGVVLLTELAKKTAKVFPDAEIEIVEKHHDRKVDAPSGTALAIADGIRKVRPEAENVIGRSGVGKRTKSEIGIHSLRMGNVVGEHEVYIATQNQTIVLRHEAHSRRLFAEGALDAAAFLIGKGPGLYRMTDLIEL